MPIDRSIAHVEYVVGSGIVLREPGRHQTTPMPDGAVEDMCQDLDARGHHAEATRHRHALQVLEAIARHAGFRSVGSEKDDALETTASASWRPAGNLPRDR